MNYLLFFITSIFSFIFYIFYKLNNGENIFGTSLNNYKIFSSLSGNLIIESISFFILAIFLFIYFSNSSLKNNLENKIKNIFPKRKAKEDIKTNELNLLDDEFEYFENNNQRVDPLCGQTDSNKKLSKKNIFNISENNIYLFRAISFIFLYILIISGILFLYNNYFELLNIINNLFGNNSQVVNKNFFKKITLSDFLYIIFNIIIVLFLVISVFTNYNIHKKFQNYISFFFSIATFTFILNYLFNIIFSSIILNFSNIETLKNQFILNLTISFFIIIFTYLFKLKYIFDNTFLHICAYLVNLLGIIYYFTNGGFSFINFIIVIILNLFLYGLSYLKLKKKFN